MYGKDGMAGQDGSLADTAFINALRYGGDLLKVFDESPTLSDPARRRLKPVSRMTASGHP